MEAVQSVCGPGIICFSLPWTIPLNLSVSKCKQPNKRMRAFPLFLFFFEPPRLVLGTCVCIYTPLKFCATTQMWTTDFCFRGSPDAAAAGAISCVTRTHTQTPRQLSGCHSFPNILFVYCLTPSPTSTVIKTPVKQCHTSLFFASIVPWDHRTSCSWYQTEM